MLKLVAGFKNSQLTKKNAAVPSCAMSMAERFPSENEAILLSVIPNSQKEIPKNHRPTLKFARNLAASVGCWLFIFAALFLKELYRCLAIKGLEDF